MSRCRTNVLPPPRSYVIRATHHRHALPPHHRVAVLRPIATGRVPQWLFVLTHHCGVGEPHAARQILCLALRAAGRTEARGPLGGKICGTGTCGDAGAAFGLAVALSDAKRGAVAVVMAMGGATIPRPAFREYLRWVLGTSTRMSFMLLRRAAAWLQCSGMRPSLCQPVLTRL